MKRFRGRVDRRSTLISVRRDEISQKGQFDAAIAISATLGGGRATAAGQTDEISIVPSRAFEIVVSRITAVCDATAPCSLLSDLRERLLVQGVLAAVAAHDTPALFDWLLPTLSYQGVSDAVAWGYMDRYGSVSHAEVTAALEAEPPCPRLRCYWSYAECGFAKRAYTCGSPEHLDGCPVPRHDLRNGRLNQTAYSLALFLRDVCDGDFVTLARHALAGGQRRDSGPDRTSALRRCRPRAARTASTASPHEGVVDGRWPICCSRAIQNRERWRAAGAGMIAIDTLVHNWMHRSGCLADLGAEHPVWTALLRRRWLRRHHRSREPAHRRAALLPGRSSRLSTARAEGNLAPLHREWLRPLQRQSHRRPPRVLAGRMSHGVPVRSPAPSAMNKGPHERQAGRHFRSCYVPFRRGEHEQRIRRCAAFPDRVRRRCGAAGVRRRSPGGHRGAAARHSGAVGRLRHVGLARLCAA